MSKRITIIGGGPSGLMAADILSAHGHQVAIYERKPSFGRKFLMAGRGGLNITHSEDLELFIQKYANQAKTLSPLIDKFTPTDLRSWCHELGEETFVGSSGRVFPKSFKASPLLRAWLQRLQKQNVELYLGHDWHGWSGADLKFVTGYKPINVQSDITILALGGASWPKLGADGSWISVLQNEGVEVSDLRPSNCGFHVSWSDVFKNKFAGQALKSVALKFENKIINGEFMMTEQGVEGSAIYAMSSVLREAIYKSGEAVLTLDLKPDVSDIEMIQRLQKPKARLSTTNYLKKTLKLSNVAIALLMERDDRAQLGQYDAQKLTGIIKNYPLTLDAPFAIDRAISTAGGVSFNSVDENFMLKNKADTYVVGEMLDWEAPTGGYLLQACFAMGSHVAHAICNQSN